MSNRLNADFARITLKGAAEEAGKVSTRNSKMPGSAFALSAKACKVGGKLTEVKGSVCHKCYALKLQKMRPSVNESWTANTDKAVALIARDPARWVAFMAFQITKAAEKTGEAYHRWFDSGDLQSLEMLEAIANVARATPGIAHWLPTREGAIVKAYKARHGDFPGNLVVRLSATMIGDAPVKAHGHTSTVHRKGEAVHGHACPASSQGNACGSCRACWSHDVANVSYPLH